MISSNDPMELIVRVQFSKMARGIDGVTHPSSTQLEIGNFETMIRFHSGPQHRQSIFSGRLNVIRFERRLCCRNQYKAIELVLFVSVLGRDQMTEMNRVETPAEKSDFHSRTT